jgi:hypothetical protein
MTTPACPPRDQLQRLLDEQLDPADAERLLAHVDDCPVCQQALEELTAGARDLGAGLRRPPAEDSTALPDLPGGGGATRPDESKRLRNRQHTSPERQRWDLRLPSPRWRLGLVSCTFPHGH